MYNNLLTLEKAKELTGKTIRYHAPAYPGNEDYTGTIQITGIISVWDYNKGQPMKGYESRTAFWKTYMTEQQIAERKKHLLILNEKGCWEPQCISLYPGYDAFSVSDADRYVTYEVIQ